MLWFSVLFLLLHNLEWCCITAVKDASVGGTAWCGRSHYHLLAVQTKGSAVLNLFVLDLLIREVFITIIPFSWESWGLSNLTLVHRFRNWGSESLSNRPHSLSARDSGFETTLNSGSGTFFSKRDHHSFSMISRFLANIIFSLRWIHWDTIIKPPIFFPSLSFTSKCGPILILC